MLSWIHIMKFADHGSPAPDRRLEKSDEEWQIQLSQEQFHITRKKGTEARFSGAHCTRYEPGTYSCICCDTVLFDAEEKFDSGTGWPSFTEPAKENVIKYKKDPTFGMIRVETLCNTCDAHLGHVFPDGPAPSGLRYCINSVSLNKIEEKIYEK